MKQKAFFAVVLALFLPAFAVAQDNKVNKKLEMRNNSIGATSGKTVEYCCKPATYRNKVTTHASEFYDGVTIGCFTDNSYAIRSGGKIIVKYKGKEETYDYELPLVLSHLESKQKTDTISFTLEFPSYKEVTYDISVNTPVNIGLYLEPQSNKSSITLVLLCCI